MSQMLINLYTSFGITLSIAAILIGFSWGNRSKPFKSGVLISFFSSIAFLSVANPRFADFVIEMNGAIDKLRELRVETSDKRKELALIETKSEEVEERYLNRMIATQPTVTEQKKCIAETIAGGNFEASHGVFLPLAELKDQAIDDAFYKGLHLLPEEVKNTWGYFNLSGTRSLTVYGVKGSSYPVKVMIPEKIQTKVRRLMKEGRSQNLLVVSPDNSHRSSQY